MTTSFRTAVSLQVTLRGDGILLERLSPDGSFSRSGERLWIPYGTVIAEFMSLIATTDSQGTETRAGSPNGEWLVPR